MCGSATMNLLKTFEISTVFKQNYNTEINLGGFPHFYLVSLRSDVGISLSTLKEFTMLIKIGGRGGNLCHSKS